MANALIFIFSLYLGDNSPGGHTLDEFSHGEGMGILNIDKCNEDSGKVCPNVLPRKDKSFPTEIEVEPNGWNVHLKLEITTTE